MQKTASKCAQRAQFAHKCTTSSLRVSQTIPSKRLYNGSIVYVPHGTVVVVFVLVLVVVFVFVIVIVQFRRKFTTFRLRVTRS